MTQLISNTVLQALCFASNFNQNNKSKVIYSMARSSQRSIHYHCVWGQLFPAAMLLKQPNGQLLIMYIRPQSATDNSIKDSRSNWPAVTPHKHSTKSVQPLPGIEPTTFCKTVLRGQNWWLFDSYQFFINCD